MWSKGCPWHLACAVALLALTWQAGYATSEKDGPSTRHFEGHMFNRTGPVSTAELHALRSEARSMVFFAYNNYMKYAFPRDELRPISCQGHDSQGGLALTLVDALDTLLVMGADVELQHAVGWLADNLDLDIDARVHVFELTIRALGGLLSTHILLERDASLVPGYDNSLLRLAEDLGNRLMPAFDTPSGIPLSWVNLRKGVPVRETRVTCTACAGTLLLEFGVLSRLTGNPKYEMYARNAAEQLHGMRSSQTGLLGNTLNVDTRGWVRRDSGIGAGIDSYYEYLLKAYLVFGDEAYLDMFTDVYTSAMAFMRLPGAWAAHGWLADVHMDTGRLARPWMSSLSAFWPGMQALAGQVADGAALHSNWTAVWNTFGGLPELFDVSGTQRHPLQKGYPLRPELMESTYLLHAATGDPAYLAVGRTLQATLAEGNRQRCGYASVADIATGELEDTMESFFLSETAKYLYLLHSNATALPDFFVFSTEGHLLPPLPHPATDPRPNPGAVDLSDVPEACWQLCMPVSAQESREASNELSRAFPLLPLNASDHGLLRHRRCQACKKVTQAMLHVPPPQVEAASTPAGTGQAACPAPPDQGFPGSPQEAATSENEVQEVGSCPAGGVYASNTQVLHQIACQLQVTPAGKFQCRHAEEVTAASPPLEELSSSTVVLQLSALAVEGPRVVLRVVGGGGEVVLLGMGAAFGPSFEDAAECSEDPERGCTVEGHVVDAHPVRACAPLVNMPATRGALVLVDRGECAFADKVMHVQQAGGRAAIVVNTLGAGELMSMGNDNKGTQPAIPAALITKAAGLALRQSLRAGPINASVRMADGAPEQAAPREASKTLDAAAAAAQAGELMQTQIQLLIPPQSQSWLQEQINAHQGDANTLMASLLAEAAAAMQKLGHLHSGAQQPAELAGQHAGSSAQGAAELTQIETCESELGT
ncbi:hypothetical protein WJX72_010087 [[Myrmecia] bisecta]|uniref:alpha-1,2-Mannosidase n=1 Tax=[Myrmecia] bisecta TaxID=41462 RepID=A0AAW1R950_9CHLO